MSAGRARVLMYHDFCADGEADATAVTIQNARRQLEYLIRHFRVVPLRDLAKELDSRAGIRNAVALTIDDGRRNFYEFFFPLLKEFRIPATFYVVTSFIDGRDWIWTDKVLWLARQKSPSEELLSGKINGFFKLLNRLSPQLRDQRITDLAARMNISIPELPPRRFAPCSWAELREMVESSLVEIGSHTLTHPILSSITDDQSWEELTKSRARIEEQVGQRVYSFCFPNGTPQDYRPTQIGQIRAAGYSSSVVATCGMLGHGADLYQIQRIGISGETDALSFAKYLDGAEYYQQKLFKTLPQKC
jgi:peptidoglycan/xylan/chitin deacetylase (PgdA/CDA1 family)